MLNMKKILVTGTVLTAFCTSAFAASADCPPQPSMSERVNAILHENDADRPCPPPLTECIAKVLSLHPNSVPSTRSCVRNGEA